MQKWIASRTHVRLVGWLGAFVLLAGMPSLEAQAPAPPSPAQFDPSDVYFQGYLAARSAEQLEAAGDFSGALEKLEKANQLFEAIRKYHPQWKPEMVQGRSATTMETTNRVRPLAEEALRKNRNTVAELEGGVTKSGKPKDPEAALPPKPSILKVDPLTSRRLEEAESEVKRLRSQLNGSSNKVERETSRAGSLMQERDDLQARLKAAETTVEGLRARLMAAPMESEMKSLNRRIETLEQEREAMALALRQSRDAHTESLARIATLQADLEIAQQKRADLERNLKTEREVSNSVVAGQRKQLEALEQELAKKNTELGEANLRITGLMNELKESRDAFSQLREERDSLLSERDQMAALLKLNEAGRIQDLIEQNMALAKNLRESNEKVDRLFRESNADKDAYTDALRDLAIAKSQINRLHQEKREQDKRLADLEKRLRDEERNLASGQASSDPAEVQVLRDIIHRQLRVQEFRRQMRDLLVEAAKDLGAKDERLTQAVDLIDAQEIVLTPEEQRLIDDRKVDGEFISPFARDRATVGLATTELNRDIAAFERIAEKSFVAGRMLAAREHYEMILEEHPGHTPSLCRLGVVHLRLGEAASAVDSFRRAIEMDSGNFYASRMLAFSLFQLGEMSAAEQAVRRAVELAPTDAKSQALLGTIYYKMSRKSEAESHFKAAINADPMLSEPYYNLALLCSRDGRLENAKNYYQQALERGALPDPKLEKKLLSP